MDGLDFGCAKGPLGTLYKYIDNFPSMPEYSQQYVNK